MVSRFVYRAHAIGLSGHITKPIVRPIPSRAVSALSPGGGHSTASHPGDEIEGIFSHRGATSEARGAQNGNQCETLVTATVKELRIEDKLSLDSCWMQLESVHSEGKQASIKPAGSFENLQIAGRTIRLESRADIYNSLDTLEALSEQYKNDPEFRTQFLREAFVGNESALLEKERKYFPWRQLQNPMELPVSRTGKTVVPLFAVLNPSEPGFHVSGNVITVEDFGTIVLGELTIGPHERRLTMLHAELGSPAEGFLIAADGDGNGTNNDP